MLLAFNNATKRCPNNKNILINGNEIQIIDTSRADFACLSFYLYFKDDPK